MDEQLPTGDPRPRTALQARRDAGLKKVSRITAVALAGSIALAGVLSQVAAQAVPGHAKRTNRAATTPAAKRSPSTSTPSSSSSSSSTKRSADTGSSTLQAPAQTPTTSSGGGGSVSGGS